MPVAPLTAKELCARVGADLPEGLEGIVVTGITTLDEASPLHVSFLARTKFAAEAEASKAGLVLAPKDARLERGGVIAVGDVWGAVLALLEHFHPAPEASGAVHPTAVVAASAVLGESVDVGPHAVIGESVRIGARTRIGAHCVIGDGAEIGEGTLLHPRVTVMHGCRVGRRVIVHSGAVIGSDGFKYEVIKGRFTKIPQVGIVVIEDDVEIGANTTIDRASFTVTRVGARTKIDNLVQIAHNVTIGSDSVIVAQVGIAGSTRIGRGVIIAGQAGIKDNVTIGDMARIGAQSGVGSDVPPKTDMLGSPALEAKQAARQLAVLKRMPDLYRKFSRFLPGDEAEK